MVYNKYLRSVIFSFLFCCVIFIIAAIYQIGAPTQSSRWIYGLNNIKTSFANSIKEHKLLIVAGSGSHFGISSQMITKEIGIPTVNAGIHAGLGTDYILYNARVLAKPGDTVLLALEYELYASPIGPSNVLVDYVVAHDSKYLLSHPWFIGLLSFERLRLGISTKLYPPAESPKWSKIVNKSGDGTDNKKVDMKEYQFRKLNSVLPIKITNPLSHNKYDFETIEKFAEWCAQNKIKLIATWPNTMWFKDYDNNNYMQILQDIENFYKNMNVPIIGKYREFMYDKSMFYDSQYHLNDEGVDRRTRQLINLLKPYFNQNLNN